MPYITLADLETRFGRTELVQLTDPVNVEAIDTEVVDRTLADVDAEIDGYVAARYALPLPSVPQLLVVIACNIARFRLMGDSTTEEARKRYEDAVKLLKALSAGQVVLPNAPALTPAAGGIAVAHRAPRRVFGPDALESY